MQKSFDTPKIVTIEKVVDETPTVRTLFFSDDAMSRVLPGQFAMVWILGVNEIPMSVMISQENGKAAFTVRKHGFATTELFSKKVGDQIGIRGPYGNSFTIKQGKLLLVGGGTGLVPLIRLVTFLKKTDDVTIIMGAKTKSEVFFEGLANKLLEGTLHKVIVVTEDGSYGQKGLVTDVMENLFRETGFDAVYTCGPEKMMHKVVQIASSNKTHVEASIERMMKCGIGICGSCCFGDVMACKDGTVFDGPTLLSNKEFGYTHRNKSGVLDNY
ncbi:MAG: dihydroorotate dehydrogenase electron transfer subunit [Thaumarchaeota archaeon]|nr:dihydroorotate dehydrogenase electron transfer subunit [Nitrososphaerota archaeon]MDE1832414.1 dihydroorotate dehydrogenase electron transfer subunit [Nitrososphaerota archaeon]